MSTILGGFVAVRVAKLSWLKHSLWVGIVAFVLYLFGIFILGFTSPDFPNHHGAATFNIFSLVTISPFVLLGGYLASRKYSEQISK